jgi:hypothetical protein
MAEAPKAGETAMLSSYLGRWMSLVLLLVLVALAAAALFLRPDYPAHVPLRIGICAFDSITAGPTLSSFASSVRERDGGDITWVWLDAGAEPEGCDFYIMTSPQEFASHRTQRRECLLLSTSRSDGSLTMGIVIVREGAEPDWSGAAFTSSISATGFISPLAAIAENGVPPSEVSYDLLSVGSPMCGEAVAFGVLFGRYGAGGLSLEELRRLERNGTIGPGKLRTVFTGPALPEILLVCDPSTEDWKSRGFARRLPRIAGSLSDPLKREMASLGMASFRIPSEGELDLLSSVPAEVWRAAGYHFP